MKTPIIQNEPDETPASEPSASASAAPRKSTNLTGRIGGWSTRHRKTAIFGWLAFVIASFAIGTAVGMIPLSISF